MPRCAGIKRDGGRCTVVVGPGATHCYSHDPGRSEAAVVNQILNTRARLIELERKIREQEELETRLEALEEVLKTRTTG